MNLDPTNISRYTVVRSAPVGCVAIHGLKSAISTQYIHLPLKIIQATILTPSEEETVFHLPHPNPTTSPSTPGQSHTCGKCGITTHLHDQVGGEGLVAKLATP